MPPLVHSKYSNNPNIFYYTMRFNLFNPLSKVKAFTLLELLVALSIFALIAVIAYTGLNTVLMTRTKTQLQAAQLAEIQMASLWLRRDMEQCVARTVRDNYGSALPLLQGETTAIELTRAGWQNPLQRTRSTLQRINYYLENSQLWRAYWQVLDRAQDSQPQVIAVLSQVEKLNFRFLDDKLQWHEQWLPTEFFLDNTVEKKISTPILRAIEINLTIKELGEIRWLYQCQL